MVCTPSSVGNFLPASSFGQIRFIQLRTPPPGSPLSRDPASVSRSVCVCLAHPPSRPYCHPCPLVYPKQNKVPLEGRTGSYSCWKSQRPAEMDALDLCPRASEAAEAHSPLKSVSNGSTHISAREKTNSTLPASKEAGVLTGIRITSFVRSTQSCSLIPALLLR